MIAHALIGCTVPYMLGIPSLTALVIGVVRDQYVLHKEYDTTNDNGEKIHVIKEFYRNTWFIESYWLDLAGLPGTGHGPH